MEAIVSFNDVLHTVKTPGMDSIAKFKFVVNDWVVGQIHKYLKRGLKRRLHEAISAIYVV